MNNLDYAQREARDTKNSIEDLAHNIDSITSEYETHIENLNEEIVQLKARITELEQQLEDKDAN
jgi:prefoldin subunit 5